VVANRLVVPGVRAKERGQQADGEDSDKKDDGDHARIIVIRYH
jgi:hypothetical protein